jgi:hypothetical protein
VVDPRETEPFASNVEAISDWESVLRQMDELSCTYYELLFAETPPCLEPGRAEVAQAENT